MIKLIALVKRKPAMTMTEFIEHYEGKHVPLIKRLLGNTFVHYERNYIDSCTIAPNLEGFESTSPNGPFDAITLFLFENESALNDFFAIASQTSIATQITDDESRFLDQSKTIINICNTADIDEPLERT